MSTPKLIIWTAIDRPFVKGFEARIGKVLVGTVIERASRVVEGEYNYHAAFYLPVDGRGDNRHFSDLATARASIEAATIKWIKLWQGEE